MLRRVLFATVAVLACPALLAHAAAKDDVTDAAKKLAAASNYSWKSTVENQNGNNGPGGGTTEGQTEKDGYTHLTIHRGDNTIEAVTKGEKGAILRDGSWMSFEEAASGDQQGPGRFIGRMLRNLKAPGEAAEDLAANVKDLKAEDGGAYAGELTEEGAKKLMTFGGGRRGGGDNANGPQVSNAKGTARFWVKDGAIAKYEYTVQGSISFNGNDRNIDRKTTVEVSNVGSTKVDVPEDAKKKIQ